MIWIKVPLTESEEDAKDDFNDATDVAKKDVINNNDNDNDGGEEDDFEDDDRVQVRSRLGGDEMGLRWKGIGFEKSCFS